MKIDRMKLRAVSPALAIAVALAAALALGALAWKSREARLECRAAHDRLLEARRLVADLRAAAGTEGGRLVTEENLSLAIDELARRGRAAGVDFLSMTPKEPPDSGGALYRILPVEVETRSTFAGLGEFLGILDELEQGLVVVESFTIVPQKENAATVESRILLHLFLAKAGANL
ncbi:MAG: hypothetical protein HYT89_04015 [Candidatus Omnitrophica bacterium]|nr:hypothetical protein [Candidatus Omnitrophota bacterium]